MITDVMEQSRYKPKTQTLLAIGAVLLAAIVYFLLPESCPESARRTAFVFILAAVFWSLEILPLYITSLAIVLLLIFLLGKPDGVLEMERTGYTIFLIPFSSPVIMLFLGGFLLAAGMCKHGVDTFIAHKAMSVFGNRPYFLLLGTLGTTAFLSMWISNTITTALMLGILQSNLKRLDSKDIFIKALVLAIPFGANIGGISTPIGSPPNAIAIGLLADMNIQISFFDWMGICSPLAILLILISSAVLYFLFRSSEHTLDLTDLESPKLDRSGWTVFAIVAFAVVMFLTSPLHGIPEALTALSAATLLLILGLLDINDIRHIQWEVLILMWGGLALGVAVEKSMLGHWVASSSLFVNAGWLLIPLFCLIAFILTMFISNTATAALLLPIALEIPGESLVMLAISITLVSNLAMMFPVSTPPNAFAYGSGMIKSRDMAYAGSIINIIALLLIITGYRYIIPFLF
ncbi:MAG: SLC13/DASS family transporter [Chlamydiia bacterium]|nr:SLC13/DASS family transporter [Chlamydiia bacterium]